MEDYLFFIHHAYEIEICAFVLMSNHFHLLVQSPQANLSQAMHYFMRETSRRIAYDARITNHLYGSTYHPTLIRGPHHYLSAYKYVYRNPVRAQLCEKVEDYPFSTLAGLLGQQKLNIPMAEDRTLFRSVECTLEWMNTEPQPEHTEEIQRALRRPEFTHSKIGPSRKPHDLESSRY